MSDFDQIEAHREAVDGYFGAEPAYPPGPLEDDEPELVSDSECHRCGCSLDSDGYCTDEFCPYSTQPQWKGS